MSEVNEIATEQSETLVSEIKHFANGLPYWGRFLAAKIFENEDIDDGVIDEAYELLLEELGIKESQGHDDITFENPDFTEGSYGTQVVFEKLENIEGVNALCEGQQVLFDDKFTLIFGANGAGKSGYVRLLKQVFHSRSRETIKPNINEENPKDVKASFTFKKDNIALPLSYPTDEINSVFEQFAVFDGDSAQKYLKEKNRFNFRPSGLNFFGKYNVAINKLEAKLKSHIEQKDTENNLEALFEGESAIKAFVQTVSKNTTEEQIAQYTPFSDEDKQKQEQVEKEYDELSVKVNSSKKEIEALEKVKALIPPKINELTTLNTHFTTEKLNEYNKLITDLKAFEIQAKSEGVSNFSTDKLKDIGSTEWKSFISSADAFAKKQNPNYPANDESCLLCHQPLGENAKDLILKYWTFIKSEAEQNLNTHIQTLTSKINVLKGLNFDLLKEDSVLGAWIKTNHVSTYTNITTQLDKLNTLCENITSALDKRETFQTTSIEVKTDQLTTLETDIANSVTQLKSDELVTKLSKLKKEKTFLLHKQKYNQHLSKVQDLVANLKWVDKVNKVKYKKRKVTDTEKLLSNKYFNDEYVLAFNEICEELNGNFGITINHTGSGGTSFRQLELKGNSPSAILSEGEQKVIAIADFLAEMKMSEINQGLIFDDPVNSLDDDRKEIIAKCIAKECTTKQVIVFTHDKPFFHHVSNAVEQLDLSFKNHMIESVGKVYLDNSPRIESKYKNTEIPYSHLRRSRTALPEERALILAHGFASLATCYEYFVKNNMLRSIISPFDKHIKLSKIKEIKLDDNFSEKFVQHYGNVCDLKEGHLPSDSYSNQEINSDLLEEEINKLNQLKEEYKNI
ncbi:AAA family ATPase [Galbibacter sp. EGI 63066]|uniref:AAA family ATPase n=1 Tax=Galbibacter sp. EGI 63066 TaxID=2993559 RepID=UPI002249166B|nr:AAA family ATPase [Galbibacter sp. EGI 63066]MCX2679621.1 AAA family ATPase [Galbibacter sp. EGI 63066]